MAVFSDKHQEEIYQIIENMLSDGCTEKEVLSKLAEIISYLGLE